MLQKFKNLTTKFIKTPQDKIEKALNVPKPVRDEKAEASKQHADHPSADYMTLKKAFRNFEPR